MAISIAEVLDTMKAQGGKFLLGFVRSSGEKKGSIKLVNCRYGAPNPKDLTPDQKAEKLNAKGGGINRSKGHKLNGTIPLTNLDEIKNGKGQYITPLVSHIVLFNGHAVKA